MSKNPNQMKTIAFDEEDESEYYISELSTRVNKLNILSNEFEGDVKDSNKGVTDLQDISKDTLKGLGITSTMAGTLLNSDKLANLRKFCFWAFLFVQVLIIWRTKISPKFKSSNQTNDAKNSSGDKIGLYKLDAEQVKMIEENEKSNFMREQHKNKVTLIIGDESSKDTIQAKKLLDFYNIDYVTLISNSIAFSPEKTREINVVTKSDMYPKICIGKDKIIDLETFNRIEKSKELFKDLIKNSIVHKMPPIIEATKEKQSIEISGSPRIDSGDTKNIDSVVQAKTDPVAEAKIQKFLKEDRVTIFSLTMCSFCKKARQLFTKIGVNIKDYQVENKEVPDDYMSLIQKKYNYHLFPMIFIGHKFIKGYDEVNALYRSGQLKKLLDEKNIKNSIVDNNPAPKPEDLYSKYLKPNQVTIFSNSNQTGSKQLLQFQEKWSITHKNYSINLKEISDEELKSLKSNTKKNEIPFVFVGKTDIKGTNSFFNQYKSGGLKILLKKHNVSNKLK